MTEKAMMSKEIVRRKAEGGTNLRDAWSVDKGQTYNSAHVWSTARIPSPFAAIWRIGFTLIELMIAVVIIGILTAIIATYVIGRLHDARHHGEAGRSHAGAVAHDAVQARQRLLSNWRTGPEGAGQPPPSPTTGAAVAILPACLTIPGAIHTSSQSWPARRN